MATRLEREDRGFYERVRDRMRRALGESPTEKDIRVHRREARGAFGPHRGWRRLFQVQRAAPTIYEQDSERLQRALGEHPNRREIRRHHRDAVAAFRPRRVLESLLGRLRKRG